MVSNPTILFCCSNTTLIEKCTAFFADHHTTVVQAPMDTSKISQLMVKHRPVMLLVDLEAPSSDFIVAINTIRRDKACPPSLLLAAVVDYQSSIQNQRHLEASFNYLLYRPIGPKALTEIIHQIISSHIQELEQSTEDEIDLQITNILHRIGMSTQLNGYKFLKDAVALLHQNPSSIHAAIEQIYAPIAQKHSTTANHVERSIRYAIETVWISSKRSELLAYLDYPVNSKMGKPVSTEFISALHYKLECSMRQGLYV